MANCLITRLAATVQNEELEYIDRIVVSFGPRATIYNGVCRFLLSEGGRVRVLSGNIYSNSDATTQITEIVANDGLKLAVFYVKPDEYAKVAVENKYTNILEINRITTSELSARPNIDFEHLKSCFACDTISFLFMGTEGAIEDIVEYRAKYLEEINSKYVLFSNTVSGVTFHGAFFTEEKNLFVNRPNGGDVVTIYGSRTGSAGNYVYGNPLATYTISTGVWSYN